MAYRSVEDSSLTGIADAIRAAGETEESLLFPEGFQTAISNLGGKGAALTVTAPGGSTVTVSKDGKTLTRVAGADGVVVFRGLETGTWTITIKDGEQTASKTVEITADYTEEISFSLIPEFTYTGDYEIVNDSDEPISVSQDNWKIRFLTSGTLTFQALNGAENGIDVFLVGGGGGGHGNGCAGGGGGGGYTTTGLTVSVDAGKSYEINIGAGGAAGSDGGNSSAFGLSADGGKDGGTNANLYGGNGGSGGGGYGHQYAAGNGGSDGSNAASGHYPGKGQGTTTREFGDPAARLYAGGGGGGTSRFNYGTGGAGGGGNGGNNNVNPTSGTANTGGGGGGGPSGSKGGAAGGSGIVIIRNRRSA